MDESEDDHLGSRNRNDTSGGKELAPMTAEQAAQQFKKQQDESHKVLANTLSVKYDNGQSYFLGMKVPKDMAFILEQTLVNARPALNTKGTEFFYDWTAKNLEYFKYSAEHSHNAGLAAAGIFSGLLIGAQPVTDLWQVYNKYNQDKKDLLQDLSNVIAVSKTGYLHNEVIKIELTRMHDGVWAGIKNFAATLPYLVPTVMSATHDYAKLKVDKDKAASISNKLNKSIEEVMKEEAERFKNGAALEMERDKVLAQAKKDFLKEYKNKKIPGTQERFTPKELDEKWRTIERRLRDELQQETYAAQKAKYGIDKADKTDNEKQDASMKPWIFGAGILSAFLKSKFSEGNEARARQTSAYQMIKHLKTEIEEQCSGYRNGEPCDIDADQIQLIMPGDKENKRISLKNYIIEVFRQNERDNGRGGIEGGLLEQLQPAVDSIASMIVTGEIDGNALVNLVGEHKIITLSGNKRTIANEEQVKKAVDDLRPVLGTTPESKPEDFLAVFPDPLSAKETIKKNMATMKGLEKALVASLFDGAVLEGAGIKKEEIVELRKQAHKHMTEFVSAFALHLMEKDQDALKKLGLSEAQVQAVSNFVDNIQSGDQKAIETAVYGRDKSIITAISIAGINEQTGGQDPWVKRIGEIATTRQKIEEAKLKKSTSADNESEMAEDGVLASAKKRIGSDLDEMPLTSAQEREEKRRGDRSNMPVGGIT